MKMQKYTNKKEDLLSEPLEHSHHTHCARGASADRMQISLDEMTGEHHDPNNHCEHEIGARRVRIELIRLLFATDDGLTGACARARVRVVATLTSHTSDNATVRLFAVLCES